MIWVFAHEHSARLDYVLDFCFRSKGRDFKVVPKTEIHQWEELDGIKINYTAEDVDADIHLETHNLLMTDRISQHKIEEKDGQILIDGFYDPFSVIFYLLTRMEEYGDRDRDKHDRFVSSNHSLVQIGLHKRPVVDELVMKVWKKLDLDYTHVLDRYQSVPSFDIDVAWAYKHRKLRRTLGGYVKGGNRKERLEVLSGKKRDPYDTYPIIYDLASKFERIICFSLLGDWGKYDKNIHWENPELGSLLRGLNAAGGMGIHPSYGSYFDPNQIRIEIDRMESIVGHEITKSRQHFLRIRLPQTYRMLLKCGISKEYSMGFADNIGFRAGTAFPHYWFDIEADEKTPLLVFPFMYMDSALKDYLKLSPEEAIEEIDQLIQNTRKVGGLFMFIWHNSSINDRDEWKGWKRVLDHTAEKSI